MRRKTLSRKSIYITIISLLISITMPNSCGQHFNVYYNEPPDPIPPRLHFQIADSEPFLKFGPDHYTVSWDQGDKCMQYSYQWDGRGADIYLNSNDNLTMAIEGVSGRIVNPGIGIFLNFDLHYRPPSNTFVWAQLRCDGDGDGVFEYIVNFGEFEVSDNNAMQIHPSETTGEAINLTKGTIELELGRTDSNSASLCIGGQPSYVQVPFDLDSDFDGTGDFTDLDDDNDGHLDVDDVFPVDPSEWRDSDWDGIGDNADTDDNGNGLEDNYEIPVAMGIVLIPLVVILAVLNRMKKKGGKDEKEEIPTLTTPYEGPKNW